MSIPIYPQAPSVAFLSLSNPTPSNPSSNPSPTDEEVISIIAASPVLKPKPIRAALPVLKSETPATFELMEEQQQLLDRQQVLLRQQRTQVLEEQQKVQALQKENQKLTDGILRNREHLVNLETELSKLDLTDPKFEAFARVVSACFASHREFYTELDQLGLS